MTAQSEHGKLLATAAKATLSPLGCVQIGRSRTWISDQRFWVIVIGFQPSGFSKGSYLNVGANWLWDAKDHWSFDHGNRVEKLTRFEDARQFEAVARHLAARATEEVAKLREKFPSLSNIAHCLVADTGAIGWSLYHAAVAAGLTGDLATSLRLFHQLMEQPATHGWEKKLRADGAALARHLPDLHAFRSAVLDVIEQSRILHQLTPDPNCLDAA